MEKKRQVMIYSHLSHTNSVLLTVDVQVHRITLPVAFSVTAHTRVYAGTTPADILQHQTLVGHRYSLRWIVVQ